MQLQQRINAFSTLGRFLGQFGEENAEMKQDIPFNSEFFFGMKDRLQAAQHHNGWFTPENLRFACKSWSEALSEAHIKTWLSAYTIKDTSPSTVAVIMAGNIPLVGFHDFLSVLISGHRFLGKLSSNDRQLLPYLASYLVAVAPEFEDMIAFSEEKLQDFDAVIATGSDNTARYFDYYFGKYPHIIRKNRNAVAMLTGDETPEQLELLANDIFRYFGLGCRNVSKIYVPEGYDFDPFFKAMYSWKDIINHTKYINNYDYNKAVYLMSGMDLLDNEFLLLKKDEGFSSPISVVFWESYTDASEVRATLAEQRDHLQCIVSIDDIPFGEGQTPRLWDYADGVDTLSFLLKLS
ncbi:MAG: acyl-CoA reductase [Altibacter sp.]|uniref:acyl-CoA reductase n=1 Tax=Altibacter sp. TaxID=2024823 RepID=UPI000C919517|nr:acyl-CoA reductase [Altibacter sp.]MAP54834.1 acyl-CoA reductase [Altibacter sp.]